MTGYQIGNLIGRLFVSYAAVWIVMFVIFTKLDWKMAFSRTNSWYGLLLVAVVLVLGIAGSVVKQQGGS